jgi:hypothetical protein
VQIGLVNAPEDTW